MKKVVKYNKHHRKPKSLGGTDHPSNLVIVPQNRHAAYHLLFNEGDPEYVAMVLNQTWIDPEYELVVKRKEVTKS